MDQVKVVFESEEGTEALWATSVERGFVVDNYPFYLKGVCFEDVVEAQLLAPGIYRYTGTVEKSGNSLYRVWFDAQHAGRATALLADLVRLGCGHERGDSDGGSLVAVNIPGAVDADAAWKILEKGLHEETWVVQEGDDRHPCTDGES
ncbi:hypothetical protein D3C72_397450 [compost metagenome]